ncbi:tRNA-splicing endonuclease subunit Sen34 [Patella vulgata]|uniref:tRNA-splicing endonuclease subunit Sen34 n=1 Tax=Patella vulgata TaxID=6465 RepID=UPI0024A90720|nr:tRNA-splicing endonuclease subunit Sen34 [Patella vulgata]
MAKEEMPMTSLISVKMSLFVTHGKVFVWNTDDVMKLREDYRIVGNLVGCLPRAPRQNIQLGLPLQLAPYEVTLLLEKGLCELLESVKLSSQVDEDRMKQFTDMRQTSHQQQIPLFIDERRKEINQHRHKIVEGKKAKRHKLKQDGVDDENNGMEEREDDFNVDDIKIPSIKLEQAIVQLFTESPWKSRISSIHKEWQYPESDSDKLRYAVFKDLWEKKYYLTSGTKFGGDFLVYPGDPALFHSFYIAVCIPHNDKLTALEIVTLGRLGATVRKTVILCSICDNEVYYTSLQWTGIT